MSSNSECLLPNWTLKHVSASIHDMPLSVVLYGTHELIMAGMQVSLKIEDHLQQQSCMWYRAGNVFSLDHPLDPTPSDSMQSLCKASQSLA